MPDRLAAFARRCAINLCLLSLCLVVASCGSKPPDPHRRTTPPAPARPTAAPSPAPDATTTSAAPTPAAPTTPPPPLRIVGLGDSVPAAHGCGCEGFVGLSGDLLSRLIKRKVVVHNDAVGGWTSRDVVQDLRHGTSRDNLTDGADLVIIEAGANDLPMGRITDPQCHQVESSQCFGPALAAVRQALTAAVQLVRHDDPDHDVRIVLMGYWNVGVDGVVGRRLGAEYVQGSNSVTLALNDVVRGVAAQNAAIYVDAYTPLKGPDGGRDASPYLLNDGDHPNRAGHRLLADAVVQQLKKSGAVEAWTNG